MPEITGIDVHTYLVKDADRAIAFWRDVVGLKPTQVMPGMGAEFELPDGATFGLWKMDDGTWMAGNGIMFAVPDVAAALAELKSKGATVVDEVEETPGCTMGFAQDTEGNHFVLHKRKSA